MRFLACYLSGYLLGVPLLLLRPAYGAELRLLALLRELAWHERFV
jgi:hypothetical protein